MQIRAKKYKNPKRESVLITTLCQELQFYENQNRLIYFRMNTGAVVSNYKNKYGENQTRFFRFGKLGCADILVITKNHERVIFLEAKTEKGKQSINQEMFQKDVEKLGLEYFIIRNNSNLEEILFG